VLAISDILLLPSELESLAGGLRLWHAKFPVIAPASADSGSLSTAWMILYEVADIQAMPTAALRFWTTRNFAIIGKKPPRAQPVILCKQIVLHTEIFLPRTIKEARST